MKERTADQRLDAIVEACGLLDKGMVEQAYKVLRAELWAPQEPPLKEVTIPIKPATG